jgi:hypothetical protein
LIAAGEMPSLDELLKVIIDVREKYTDRIREVTETPQVYDGKMRVDSKGLPN